jgi:hypothetical protein
MLVKHAVQESVLDLDFNVALLVGPTANGVSLPWVSELRYIGV